MIDNMQLKEHLLQQTKLSIAQRINIPLHMVDLRMYETDFGHTLVMELDRFIASARRKEIVLEAEATAFVDVPKTFKDALNQKLNKLFPMLKFKVNMRRVSKTVKNISHYDVKELYPDVIIPEHRENVIVVTQLMRNERVEDEA